MDRLEHLHLLRGALQGAALDLPTPGADEGVAARDRAVRRLGDHVLPRLASADAPLLAVIGGSTGAGKSTVLNSLLRRRVSVSSAVRPTTRRPLLIHRGADAAWFEETRILPGMARVRVAGSAAPTPPVASDEGAGPSLEVRSLESVPTGMALLDAPDLDSVVDDNRALARQLLDAADLWVFVTTAARYADAVPWEVLSQAGHRDIACAVVLNRVPPGAVAEVSADLRRLMAERSLGEAPLFVVEEQPLTDQLLPADALSPLRDWLEGLGADALTRGEVARRTLAGSVSQVVEGTRTVEAALGEHDDAVGRALGRIDAEVEASLDRLGTATANGTLLRGEVLARWQEVVGAADLSRSIERGVSMVRDRIGAFLRGRPAPVAPVEDALGEGLSTLLREELARTRDAVEEAWANDPALAGVGEHVARPAQADLDERAVAVARAWQGDLLLMVRTQGGSRRITARVMALGVNVVGVALMVVIFASTAGVTGTEVGVAGATAVLSQKLLEAVFGDQAVRTMSTRAHGMLLERARSMLTSALADLRAAVPSPSDVATLTDARSRVEEDWA